MDLRRLRLFLAVVDHGGFTCRRGRVRLAAVDLAGGAQAERELGTDLFHRVGRSVVLTPAGEALVAPARQALRRRHRPGGGGRGGRPGGRGARPLRAPTLAVDPLAPLVGTFDGAPRGGRDTRRPGRRARSSRWSPPRRARSASHRGADRPRAPRTGSSSGISSRYTPRALPPRRPRRSRSWSASRSSPVSRVRRRAGSSTRRAGCGVAPRSRWSPRKRRRSSLVLAGAGATMLPAPLAESARRLGAVVVPFRPRA